jgi:hypothetical protein
MHRSNSLYQWLRASLPTFACTVLACSTTAVLADQVEEHNAAVAHYVDDFHADPLLADCAAHASFVVSTSTLYDHVEFPSSAFDSDHAALQPWQDSFDDKKQRVKVDTIATIGGLGFRKTSEIAPDDLKFRCGYVEGKMLAFSWNDPVPPAVAHVASKGGKKKRTRRKKHP